MSIVIPAYNESRRIGPSIDALKRYSAKNHYITEIILSIEKSDDGTLRLAKRFTAGSPKFIVLDTKVHKGKGHAVRQGIMMATGEIIIFMDADLSTDLSAIRKAVNIIEVRKSDIVVGNRALKSSEIMPQKLLRRTMGKLFNILVRTLGFSTLHDTQCGFKAFNKESAKTIFNMQQIDGFAFDVEILYLASKLGYRVIDIPVEWTNSIESKVKIIGGSTAMLRDLAKIRFTKLT